MTATPAVHEGHLPGSREYRRIAWALFIAGVATFALLYSTQALLPDLAARFDVSTGASTLTLSLTTLGLGIALLVAGPASDRLGRHCSALPARSPSGCCWPRHGDSCPVQRERALCSTRASSTSSIRSAASEGTRGPGASNRPSSCSPACCSPSPPHSAWGCGSRARC
jgi:hypothetical protein